jgi:hypothetical protein
VWGRGYLQCHLQEFSPLNNQQEKTLSTSAPDSKFVLTDPEKIVLRKGLNFTAAKPHSILDRAHAAKRAACKLLQMLNIQFRWKVRSTLEKSSAKDMTSKEFKGIKSLKLNKDIRTL